MDAPTTSSADEPPGAQPPTDADPHIPPGAQKKSAQQHRRASFSDEVLATPAAPAPAANAFAERSRRKSTEEHDAKKYALAASALVELERQEVAEKAAADEAAAPPKQSRGASTRRPMRPAAAGRHRGTAASRHRALAAPPRATVSAPGGSRGEFPPAAAHHNRAHSAAPRHAVQRNAMLLQKLRESPLAPMPRAPGRWPALRGTAVTRAPKASGGVSGEQTGPRLVALPAASSPPPHAHLRLPPLARGGRRRQPPTPAMAAWRRSGATPKIMIMC
jgi:hypothetical protein